MTCQREQTILITGAASGIGRATAEAALAAGLRVIATDRDATGLGMLGAETGGNERLLCQQLDVCDEAAVSALFDAAETGFGAVTGVVNSAGIAADVPVTETDTALFRKILDINVIGSFTIAREAVRRMQRRDGGGGGGGGGDGSGERGAIVNIASVSGIQGNKGRSAYGASKGAIITMTRVMAVELAHQGIRVNAIAPGPIETALARAIHGPEVRAMWEERTPLGHYGQPRDIAESALFLLDPHRAGYITGQVLAVDGGFSIAGLIDRAAG